MVSVPKKTRLVSRKEVKPCAYYGNESYCEEFGSESPCYTGCPKGAGPPQGQQEQTESHACSGVTCHVCNYGS